jgi:uncharacterized membrane protein YhhN
MTISKLLQMRHSTILLALTAILAAVAAGEASRFFPSSALLAGSKYCSNINLNGATYDLSWWANRYAKVTISIVCGKLLLTEKCVGVRFFGRLFL